MGRRVVNSLSESGSERRLLLLWMLTQALWQTRGVPISSCFVRRAGPVHPRLSTYLFQISHTMILAGLYTNKSNSFYSKSHMYLSAARAPTASLWFTYCMGTCPPL